MTAVWPCQHLESGLRIPQASAVTVVVLFPVKVWSGPPWQTKSQLIFTIRYYSGSLPISVALIWGFLREVETLCSQQEGILQPQYPSGISASIAP